MHLSKSFLSFSTENERTITQVKKQMLDENYFHIRRSQTKDCCVIQVTYKARINIQDEETERERVRGSWLVKQKHHREFSSFPFLKYKEK